MEPAPTPREPGPLHGWIVVDKPLGLSSAQGVAAVKRILRQAGYPKVKIGHGGTLDPLATGVLPIALGEATKLAGRMLDATKGYAFTVAWGVATATDDREGEVVATSGIRPDKPAIAAALHAFRGPIVQTPPAYSALKVDGERAYKLARAGETVVLAERNLTIHAFDLFEARDDDADFAVTCSKGTYVRSLARDLAISLGTVGHVAALRRTRAGPFTLDAAISLDKLADLLQAGDEQAILPLTAGLDDIPALSVTPEDAALLRQGRTLPGHPASHGLYLATDGPVPVALVEVSSIAVRVVRGFNLT
ncbi:tRNA pseudouridine(55) synthase TruB [Glacieibacterium megasporae]|uniref:tRNA pseudouridine(55) synthase TruB n=1 Tax=Glacieibacterium megasporae TaxID=2835787 RepID=UPI001C1E323C|nr:tRNA pseudouridine(55) synthase TruB [Polymorphobacter megasporae]UAJ12013.1 tRNA pseudouridine(55) synthase TruB [Polymorphobacter megasporae]